MTRSANDPAVIPASNCEAILRGMSKRADKEGDWIQVVWQIHPNEVPQALWNADLRSRWQLAFVEIGDNEEPKAPAKQKWPHGGGMAGHDADSADEKPKERKQWGDTLRSMQAAIRVTSREWRHWAKLPDTWTADDCTNWIKQSLVIQSRKELDSDPEKSALWDKMDAAFIEATRLPERH